MRIARRTMYGAEEMAYNYDLRDRREMAADNREMYCHRCGTSRNHSKTTYFASTKRTGMSLARMLLMDVPNALSAGGLNKLAGQPYECSSCGHFRTTTTECFDSTDD